MHNKLIHADITLVTRPDNALPPGGLDRLGLMASAEESRQAKGGNSDDLAEDARVGTDRGTDNSHTRSENKSADNSDTSLSSSSSVLDLPIPNDDYELNIFLDAIAEDITDDELHRMKHILKGQKGMGRRVLEKIKTALDLFDHLQNLRLLNRNNMLYIQSLLWHVGKKDLHQSIVDFSREFSSQPLYFFAPNKMPVNGFKHIEFHVRGALETVTREQLEHLRSLVSRLARVPVEFVNVEGITPFKSLVITFMLPEEVVDVLLQLSEKEKSLLQDMRIDFFTLDDQQVQISGMTFEKPETLREMDEVKKIMTEKGELEQELDKSQADLFEKGKELKLSLKELTSTHTELEELKEKHVAAKRELSALKDKYADVKWEKNEALIYFSAALSRHILVPPSKSEENIVSKQNILKHYKHSFKVFCSEYPECTESIQSLLEANSMLVRGLEQEVWTTYTNTLQAKYNYMEYEYYKMLYFITGKHFQSSTSYRKWKESTWTVAKYPATKEISIHKEDTPQETRKQRLFRGSKTQLETPKLEPPKLETNRKASEEESSTPPTPISDPHYQALGDISRVLKPEQKEKIRGNYRFNKVEEAEFKKYPEKFLSLVLKKENHGSLPPTLDIKKAVMDKLSKFNDVKLVERAEKLFENARMGKTTPGKTTPGKTKTKDVLMSSAVYSKHGPPKDWYIGQTEETPKGIHVSKSAPSIIKSDEDKLAEESNAAKIAAEEKRMKIERDKEQHELTVRLERMEEKMDNLLNFMSMSPLLRDPDASPKFGLYPVMQM